MCPRCCGIRPKSPDFSSGFEEVAKTRSIVLSYKGNHYLSWDRRATVWPIPSTTIHRAGLCVVHPIVHYDFWNQACNLKGADRLGPGERRRKLDDQRSRRVPAFEKRRELPAVNAGEEDYFWKKASIRTQYFLFRCTKSVAPSPGDLTPPFVLDCHKQEPSSVNCSALFQSDKILLASPVER